MRVAWQALWAVGGLIALIVGLILHSHYSGINRACSTGAGALGQAFSTTVHHDCSGASLLTSVGEILLWAGVFALIGGILGLIFSGSQGRFNGIGAGRS